MVMSLSQREIGTQTNVGIENLANEFSDIVKQTQQDLFFNHYLDTAATDKAAEVQTVTELAEAAVTSTDKSKSKTKSKSRANGKSGPVSTPSKSRNKPPRKPIPFYKFAVDRIGKDFIPLDLYQSGSTTSNIEALLAYKGLERSD
jgi:hypothetical protein